MTQTAQNEVADWLAGRAERTIETSLAWIFLAGDTAFKLKRPVVFSFVDFSSAQRRRWALERELEFNRATARDVYRQVRRVTRGPGGALELDGRGETLDYVLEMRRFDDEAVLAANPAALDGALAERLGRMIAGFHADAPLRPQGGLAAMSFTVGSNALQLRQLAPRLGAERVERLVTLTDAEFANRSDLLARRTAAGFARRCHGDLHLGNILVENGQAVLFDCIEFNDLLSDLDVQYDLAFLLMDLQFRGRADAAVRVLSAWLDEAARHFPAELWAGLAALPLMLSVRAGVRAHVCAHGGDDASAIAYADAAIAHLSPRPAVLAAVGGFSGVGKSGFARRIAPRLGPSPGAVVLRTDEVRKRLAGLPATARGSAALYTPDVQAAAYEAMFEAASALLRAGHGVVLDATFLDEALRRRAERLATECGVAFHGAWLEASAEDLRRRVAARQGDASDATVEVLATQLGRDLGEIGWTRIDASGPLAAAAATWTSGAAD